LPILGLFSYLPAEAATFEAPIGVSPRRQRHGAMAYRGGFLFSAHVEHVAWVTVRATRICLSLANRRFVCLLSRTQERPRSRPVGNSLLHMGAFHRPHRSDVRWPNHRFERTVTRGLLRVASVACYFSLAPRWMRLRAVAQAHRYTPYPTVR